MNKKVFIFASLCLIGLTSCNNSSNELSFEKKEYNVYSGEAIKVEQNYSNVKYEIVGNNKYDVKLNAKTGMFTFADDIPNYAQVMCVAKYKSMTTEPVVVTLLNDYEVAEITFDNLSSYIVDGEFVTATASLSYAMTYSLKENVPGISIDSSSGKIKFTEKVKNKTPFIVVAQTHNNAKSEKTFYSLTENFASVINNRQVVERNSNGVATFKLDFSKCVEIKEQDILGLANEQNTLIDKSNYSYNIDNATLTIKSSYLNNLYDGINGLKIITSLNAIAIDVEIATKFIYTPEDLASINDNEASLSGYYVLMNDIDLTDYLSQKELGWTPIGGYQDVIDPNIATKYAFKGTFDGDGHVIYNMRANRKDEKSFNAGLFGYLTSSAIIKNLGVTGTLNVSSYSGGLVGSNSGTISNCWANVDVNVYTGEDVYRYVGGLVGNNFGTIENCYSMGEVLCDSYYGAFVGYNDGEIINCYALSLTSLSKFVGFGLVDESCILFNNETLFKQFDFSKVFTDNIWRCNKNELPVLVPQIVYYSITKMAIKKDLLDNTYYEGDKIIFDVDIFPKSLENVYKQNVKYSLVKNGGAHFEENVLHTLNAINNKLEIKATLDIDGVQFEDQIEIILAKHAEQIIISYNTDTLYTGQTYELEVKFLPNGSVSSLVFYAKTSDTKGLRIENNKIIISEDATISELSVYACDLNTGLKSNELTFKVKKVLNLTPVALYSNEDAIVDLDNVTKVEVDNKEVSFEKVNNGIKISKNSFKANSQAVTIITTMNNVYRVLVTSYAHTQYNKEYVLKNYQNVIEIRSVLDLYKYFNLSDNDNKVMKQENYHKVFMITSDLDFNGASICGIGVSGDNQIPFSGKIFGLGHTISNFKITKNETSLFEDSSTSQYGVGLFSVFSGEMYDLNIKNVQVEGKNFVGGLVGIMSDGFIENCHIYNDINDITASGYIESQDEVYVAGLVGKKFKGTILGCTYNYTNANVIGGIK